MKPFSAGSSWPLCLDGGSVVQSRHSACAKVGWDLQEGRELGAIPTLARSQAASGPATISLTLDAVIYALQRVGGITHYWQHLCAGLANDRSFQIDHLTPSKWGRLLRPVAKGRVFHSSYYRTARGPGVLSVVNAHDMAFELGHIPSSLRARVAIATRRRAYERAQGVICGSEAARRDFLAVYPELAGRVRIAVIYHGVNLRSTLAGAPAPVGAVATAGKATSDRPFVLFVGGRSAYKNFIGALEGFHLSGLANEGVRLVCTGAPASPEELTLVAKFGLQHRVDFIGPVGDGQLAQLYRTAHCLVYPSRYEGFGMPIIEAMSLGCPVVASDCSAIPEVAGAAALMCEGGVSHPIAKALQELAVPEIREHFVAAGKARALAFSWERAVQEHAQFYRELVASA